MTLETLLILSVFHGFTYVNALRKDQVCFDTVFEAYSYVAFEGDDRDVYYYSLCQYPPKVLSIYAAGETYCTPSEVTAGAELLAAYCGEYGPDLQLLPISDFQANLTEENIQSIPVVTLEEAMAEATPYSTPVLISPSFFSAMHKTVVTWDYEIWTHRTYGFAMYGFWGSVLLIGIVNNVINWCCLRPRTQGSTDVENNAHQKRHVPFIVDRFREFVAKYLIVPSTLGSHHQRLRYGFKYPTRVVSIVVVMYWCLSLILCAVNIDAYMGNLYWTAISDQVLRYLADRTGIIAYANLPLLWIFAGRNNIFQWATGWSFSTFNIFHRNIARVATIEAIVHSALYTVMYLREGKEEYYEAYAEAWFYLGVVATILMSLLLGASSIVLRKRAYEVFLLLHISMSVAVIVSLFYHTSIFDGEYNPYLWPLVAIWSFDRALRFVRIAHCNVRVKSSRKIIEVTSAVATYSAESDVITLDIIPGSFALKPKPGQHFFIYQPFTWKGWENHPFTLGAWSVHGESSPITEISGPPFDIPASNKDIESAIIVQTQHLPVNTSTASSQLQSSAELHLTFWIRPFDGWTRRIRDKCKFSPDGRSCMKLLLEGPYGHLYPVHAFEAVLLIAGGTGVSAVNPYLQEHVRQHMASDKAKTKSIQLIFSAKEATFIDQIYATELKRARECPSIKMEFFVTGEGTRKAARRSFDSTVESASADSFKARLQIGLGISAAPIFVQHRRADVKASILGFIASNSVSGKQRKSKPTAVLVCGPAGMADDARSAVISAMQQGLRVEYFEEAFGW